MTPPRHKFHEGQRLQDRRHKAPLIIHQCHEDGTYTVLYPDIKQTNTLPEAVIDLFYEPVSEDE